VKQAAIAGTLESSDVMVTVKPNDKNGLDIGIQSVVITMFGDSIRAVVDDVLSRFDVKDAVVELNDKGAVDCVIRARVEAALCRASTTDTFQGIGYLSAKPHTKHHTHHRVAESRERIHLDYYGRPVNYDVEL
jgi:citrate lyase subunit gamma (acyl carrier protein)